MHASIEAICIHLLNINPTFGFVYICASGCLYRSTESLPRSEYCSRLRRRVRLEGYALPWIEILGPEGPCPRCPIYVSENVGENVQSGNTCFPGSDAAHARVPIELPLRVSCGSSRPTGLETKCREERAGPRRPSDAVKAEQPEKGIVRRWRLKTASQSRLYAANLLL
jgi:hypothetical protein